MTAILGFLGALSPRTWVTIIIGALIAAVLAWVVAWAVGKDRAIERTQGQRNAAILFAVRQQVDLSIARVNVAVLTGAIFRQNEAIAAQAERDATTLASARNAVAAAQRSARTAAARADALVGLARRPPAGAPVLDRLAEVDRQVLEGAR